jgi:hypothetical protein
VQSSSSELARTRSRVTASASTTTASSWEALRRLQEARAVILIRVLRRPCPGRGADDVGDLYERGDKNTGGECRPVLPLPRKPSRDDQDIRRKIPGDSCLYDNSDFAVFGAAAAAELQPLTVPDRGRRAPRIAASPVRVWEAW